MAEPDRRHPCAPAPSTDDFRGDRRFDGIDRTHLQLLDTTTFGSRIIVTVYGPERGAPRSPLLGVGGGGWLGPWGRQLRSSGSMIGRPGVGSMGCGLSQAAPVRVHSPLHGHSGAFTA